MGKKNKKNKKNKKSENQAIQNESTGKYITGVMVVDFENRIGASSLFRVESVRGMPVEAATLNANMWRFVGGKSYNLTEEAIERDLVKVIIELLGNQEIADVRR